MHESTLPELSSVADRGGLPAPPTLMLNVAWSNDEPQRLGEVCLLPPGEPGPWRVFGRGDAQPSDPHPRLQFMRLRPGSSTSTGWIENVHISRVQMLMRAHGAQSIEFQSIGQSSVSVNGARVQAGQLRPGDVIQVGAQLLLLCCKRPAWEDALADYPDFPFGDADVGGFIGESSAAWAIRRQIAAAARDHGHVLITGASGTGKELVARSIHTLSSRAGRPLICRNAATFPEGLVDAELFGNAKNYPNSGMFERPGLVGEAHQSTLFLDEIGELPASLQSHLLRVLDSGEYQRLGDSTVRRSDIRVIAATNREVTHLKHDFLARFRIRLHVPDLNTRREDVPLIARALWNPPHAAPPGGDAPAAPGTASASGKISQPLMHKILYHRYRANVRELDRMLRDALLGPPEAAELAGGSWQEPDGNGAAPAPSYVDPTSLTPEQIVEALAKNDHKQERAWRALGLSSRYALGRLMKKHNIQSKR